VKCVLVVDDSRFVRTTFASILKASFTVREAADGEAAWEAIGKDESIVMVFTDLDMPKLDGFGLLARMRESGETRIRELPVVVISGNEEASNKQRARELGATDFIAKSADATEVLSRLDNVLRLVSAKRQATHDPLTGTLTPHYLMTEGRKHFAHAHRHGGELSVLALRLDTYDEIVRAAGKEIADVVIVRVSKLLVDKVRTEDSVARTGAATFMVVAAGTAAAQMVAAAQRLRRELDEAKVTYRDQRLKFAASFGVASARMDPGGSIEDLMRLALQRLQSMPRAPVAPAAPEAVPAEVERALQVLERARFGKAAAAEVMRRLKRIASALN
jgi:diguanylate cyclase (GGDEF)-like protein